MPDTLSLLTGLKGCTMKMAKETIEQMFAPGNETKRRKDIENQCQCYPNQVHRVNGWFVLVCLKSRNGAEYPIGERGYKRALFSLEQGFVVNAYVVLADRDEDGNPVYVNHQTIGNVGKLLNGASPVKLRKEFGPCWFVSREFEPNLNMNGPRDTYEM